MAPERLPQPGTEYGPCAEECQHKDCAKTRAMAAAICKYCQKPIGYDIAFNVDIDAEYSVAVDQLLLVHHLCLCYAIEDEIKAHITRVA